MSGKVAYKEQFGLVAGENKLAEKLVLKRWRFL